MRSRDLPGAASSIAHVSRMMACLGEFTRCVDSGVCTMSTHWCGDRSACKPGQYLCPSDSATCVDSAADYTKCPGMRGTHLDWTLSTEARLDYLVAHTNLSAQISQLQNTAPEMLELGIPEYQWLNDDQHGVARTPARATVFPNGVGLGATFAHDTLRAVGGVIGSEARGLHNGFLELDPSGRQMACNGCSLTMYAPNLNLVRDPRWGRAQEVYGEDPLHMSELVVQFVHGAQNNSRGGSTDAAGHLQAGTCCKHFAVYDMEGNAGAPSRVYFDAKINARDMWETYMPAFKACVKTARSSHVMCSYNSLNGVPTCGNKGLLTTVLRDTWKWDGFVVSDYDAWANIVNTHHFNATMEAGAAQGLNAGMDQEGGGNQAVSQLLAGINDSLTTPTEVARAFRNLFRLRIRLGMLDPPTSVSYNALRYNATELATNHAHLSVARTAALELMTLLENKGRALPLDDGAVGRLAVIGPQANVSGLLFGNYAGSANDGNWGDSIEAALRKRLQGGSVTRVPGLDSIGAPNSSDGFKAAAAAAATADATVVVLGLAFDQYCAGKDDGLGDHCEREGLDRRVIELPLGQQRMVAAVRSAAPRTPLVCLLVHGGAVALSNATRGACDAVLDAWYPGIEGGTAVAATIFGDVSPAGRTPVTFYRATADLPPITHMGLYANASTGSNGITYRYFEGEPLYPFGFGLSYTTFAYSDLKLDAASHAACDTVALTVTVTNTGKRTSDEVVQVYLMQPDATVPAPRVRLGAFKRVRNLAPAASVTVALSVPAEARAVVHGGDATGDAIYAASAGLTLEKGRLEVFVGGGQPDHYEGRLSATTTITETKKASVCM